MLDMDEPGWNKLVRKRKSVCDSTYASTSIVKFLETQSRLVVARNFGMSDHWENEERLIMANVLELFNGDITPLLNMLKTTELYTL